jgi:cytochrome c oxidase subunit III
MAVTFPSIADVELDKQPDVNDGGSEPPRAPERGFGGGGGNEDPRAVGFRERLRRCRLGLTIGLVSVTMIFAAFTSAMVARKGFGTDWSRVTLPSIIWINTLILLVSSLTLEFARRRLAWRIISPFPEDMRRGFPWLEITVALGLAFLGGQLLLWRELVQLGFYVNQSIGSTFIYLMTGVHGAHLIGAIVALAFAALLPEKNERRLETKAIVADVTGWYWHFMGVLWLFILILLYTM